jgi:SM-20-related protein
VNCTARGSDAILADAHEVAVFEHPAAADLLPYCVLSDFLPPESVDRLLAETVAMESYFSPSTVSYASGGRGVDRQFRISLVSETVPQRLDFQMRLQQCLPFLMAELPVVPFVPTRMELEIAAHGDGAFFRRHLDAPAPDRANPANGLRMISGVYYFHGQPKGFSGGVLRLYGKEPLASFTDIAPTHNSFVAFPSWLPHEVMPVVCPSHRFCDNRFAINCWFNGVLKR